jgi:hypothetical protein
VTTASREEAQITSSTGTMEKFANTLAIFVGLGLLFQVGHFVEHSVQFVVWFFGKSHWVIYNFCGRDTPFMSRPATEMVGLMGAYLFPNADRARQMMLGVEILHLIGNCIFLASIAGTFYFIPTRWVRYALYIEGGHLCEHISLTLSAYYLGKPIGLSTLFGQAPVWWGNQVAVGWRVSWHFLMNLLPLPFVMIALMQHHRVLRVLLLTIPKRSLGGALLSEGRFGINLKKSGLDHAVPVILLPIADSER